jgi:hypothetical protein
MNPLSAQEKKMTVTNNPTDRGYWRSIADRVGLWFGDELGSVTSLEGFVERLMDQAEPENKAARSVNENEVEATLVAAKVDGELDEEKLDEVLEDIVHFPAYQTIKDFLVSLDGGIVSLSTMKAEMAKKVKKELANKETDWDFTWEDEAYAGSLAEVTKLLHNACRCKGLGKKAKADKLFASAGSRYGNVVKTWKSDGATKVSAAIRFAEEFELQCDTSEHQQAIVDRKNSRFTDTARANKKRSQAAKGNMSIEDQVAAGISVGLKKVIQDLGIDEVIGAAMLRSREKLTAAA